MTFIQMETEKERRERISQEIQSLLRRQEMVLNILIVALILAAIGVLATIWAALKT